VAVRDGSGGAEEPAKAGVAPTASPLHDARPRGGHGAPLLLRAHVVLNGMRRTGYSGAEKP
jgi:hypothetical protein